MQKENNLKVCTLSGTGEVGRNCSFIEYNNQILIVDCGFSFPGEELYGIDYLIPNTSYLKQNKKKILGILITHGHLDHTGALPYVLEDLGFPKIYAGKFANALISERLEEFDLNKKTTLIDVHRNTDISLGGFKISFIGVTHSIPNAFSIFIQTEAGNVFFSGDYKIDREPANEPETDYSKLSSLKGNVDLALMESTNAFVEGQSKSETEIASNLEEVISHWKGRVVVASFSSLVSRLYSVMQIAQKNNRKVAISGRSIKTTLRIAQEQGYIKIAKETLIDESQLGKYSDNQVLLLSTGSQAERYAALNRISLIEHKHFRVKSGDLVILSSSDIPDNITRIQGMSDRLIRQGAELIRGQIEDLHQSGHALQMDIKSMYEMIKPKWIMPVHGNMTLRYQNKKNFIKWGFPEENLILTDDGQIWEFIDGAWKRGRQIESKPILIDGLGVGDTSDIVLKDRKQLAEYGMVCVIANLAEGSDKLLGDPKFISRGFVYVKASQKLMNEMGQLVKDIHRKWINKAERSRDDLAKEIEKGLGGYVYKKTEREPMILPVFV